MNLRILDLYRVSEHVIKSQISELFLSSINEHLYAFRQGNNTTHLLLKLAEFIREDLN